MLELKLCLLTTHWQCKQRTIYLFFFFFTFISTSTVSPFLHPADVLLSFPSNPILSLQRVIHPRPGVLPDLPIINPSVYISLSCLLPFLSSPHCPLPILLHLLPFTHPPDRLIYLLLLPSSAVPCLSLFSQNLWSHCAGAIVALVRARFFFFFQPADLSLAPLSPNNSRFLEAAHSLFHVIIY